MTSAELEAFARHLARDKLAISAMTTLGALKARAAQGVRVNPAMMQRAEYAAEVGMKSTPKVVRRTALHAGEAGIAQAKMQKSLANPVTQAAHSRLQAGYERAVKGTPGVFDPSRRLPSHYDYGAIGMATGEGNLKQPIGYSKQHIDSLVGGKQWGKDFEHALPDPAGTAPGIRRRGALRQVP